MKLYIDKANDLLFNIMYDDYVYWINNTNTFDVGSILKIRNELYKITGSAKQL